METEFHRWLKIRRDCPSAEHVLIGVGDDAAVLRPTSDALVVTTDTIAEGTHFDLSCHSLELVGRKALAVNLSDLAAMASRPQAAVLTFLLPRTFLLADAKALYTGAENLASRFDLPIIGGDTNAWEGPLVMGATLLGSRSPDESGWAIGGARPGDVVMVSGSFGGSIHGRHLSFEPRVDLALSLAGRYPIHAATDASDSLSLDLNAIAMSSRCGVDLDLTTIPISPDVQASDPEQALHHALSDGEDFELILAVPPSVASRILDDGTLSEQLTAIGTFTDEHRELRAVQADGGWTEIHPQGYIH